MEIASFKPSARAQKTISFNVTGTEGSTGFCRVTIPTIIVQNLWQDNYTVLVDGEPCPLTNSTDTTNTYLYFNYTHSQHQTVIILEVPSLLIWPILMIATLLTLVARIASSKTRTPAISDRERLSQGECYMKSLTRASIYQTLWLE